MVLMKKHSLHNENNTGVVEFKCQLVLCFYMLVLLLCLGNMEISLNETSLNLGT